MATSRSGEHDRRGFDAMLKFALVMAGLSLILLVIYSWKIGLALFMISCIAFITLEVISAPPENSPRKFAAWLRRRQNRRPVLLCLGDSITHGTVSANITPEIPFRLAETLGLPPANEGSFFFDPLWVVNAGQNYLSSHALLQERLPKALGCYPDFIYVMIGTNDVLAMSGYSNIIKINDMPGVPTMATYERNLTQILSYLYQSSPMSQVAV